MEAPHLSTGTYFSPVSAPGTEYRSGTGPFIWGGSSAVSEQLELFSDEPFCVRLTIIEGIQIFRSTYWDRLPKGKTTAKCFERILTYCQIKGIRYCDEFNKSRMEKLLEWLEDRGCSVFVRNSTHAIITRFFNKLMEWKEGGKHEGVDFSKIPLPNKNPGSQVSKVDEAQFAKKVAWPKKVVYRLIESAKELNDHALAEKIEMLYLTGLRPSDLFRITERNVDLAHLILTGTQHKTVTSNLPSGRPFRIALTAHMAEIIRKRMEWKPAGEPIFGNSSYTHESWMRQINRRFDVVKKYAGMPHVQLKHMRGSSTTLLLDNNIDIETVRERGGWSTDRMIPIYGRRTIVHQKEAQSVLEKPDTEIIM